MVKGGERDGIRQPEAGAQRGEHRGERECREWQDFQSAVLSPSLGCEAVRTTRCCTVTRSGRQGYPGRSCAHCEVSKMQPSALGKFIEGDLSARLEVGASSRGANRLLPIELMSKSRGPQRSDLPLAKGVFAMVAIERLVLVWLVIWRVVLWRARARIATRSVKQELCGSKGREGDEVGERDCRQLLPA